MLIRFYRHLAQDKLQGKDYDFRSRAMIQKRYLIPLAFFLFGSALIASLYLSILTWAQGWDYALSQFLRDRAYVLPILLGFGIQAALYSVLRFRLFVSPTSTYHVGPLVSASGGFSTTTMIACCIHHVSDLLPILGISAAATFLTRYQRPFMLVSVFINMLGIVIMLIVLYSENQKLHPVLLETK
jgi:hypothetical protein